MRQITRDEYIKYIKLQLGAPVVDIEVDEQLNDILVTIAFEELKHFMTAKAAMTLPFAPVIDLTNIRPRIATIEAVWRGRNNNSPVSFPGMGYFKMQPGLGLSSMVQDYANALRIRQNIAAIATDMDYFVEPTTQKLYIFANMMQPNTVTLIYQPDYETPEEIWSQYWQDQLKQMALNHTKVILGQIRGKFTRGNALWAINGERILQEGLTGLAEQRQYLRANRNLSATLD